MQFTIQHLFSLRDPQRRTARQLLCELSRRALEFVARHNAIVEANPFGLAGFDKIAGHQEFSGFRQAHDARQQIRRAHVRSGQSDLYKDERDFRFLGGDANV